MAAQSGRSRRGRSDLYAWMWEHFDQVNAERVGRPDWVWAAEYYTKLGITDAAGGELKPRHVRRCWERVLRNRKALVSASPASPGPLTGPLPRPASAAAFERPAEPDPFEFRTLGSPQGKKE